MLKKILIFLGAVAAVLNIYSLGLLNDIKVETKTGKTEIVLDIDKVVNFTDFSITAPDIIVVDLIAIDNGMPGYYYQLNTQSGVKSLEIMKDEASNFLRVMIELDKRYKYSKEYRGNSVVITLDNAVSAENPTWRASENEAMTKAAKNELDQFKNEYIITMDVENADVVTLLRGISNYVGLNIVISNQVKGNVTVHVKDVPWKDLFDMVTRLAGLTYEEYPNMIRVGTFKEFAIEQSAMEESLPMVTRVYKLEFANPSDIQKALTPLITRRGRITIDARTNSIIVNDVSDVQAKVQSIIEKLDQKNLQVEIVVKVVELTRTTQKQLGINWSIDNVGISTANVTGGASLSQPMGGGTVSIGTIRNFGQINATLDALEIAGNSKTISNPRVTATNNEEAEILGGKQFFVQSMDAQGNVASNQYTVGTILRVTPHVNSTNDITLEIYAELSTVEGETTTRPVINTTQAQTIQMVQDGETVVMGGFVISQDSRRETGFPLLRSIPIIGHLFKSDTSNKDLKEVLIFLTPHIVQDIE